MGLGLGVGFGWRLGLDERHLCGWLNPTQFAELLWTAKFVYSDE